MTDLRDGYPLPLLCVEPSEVVRVHASSGTTGKRKILAYTQKDRGHVRAPDGPLL